MASKSLQQENARAPVQRISVSLPDRAYRELDAMVEERGLENRSKAIVEMITQAVVEHQEDKGDQIMAGTITLIYDEAKGNLLQKLAELERTHIDEVISSLHVQLQDNHRMEVILVQGPAAKLKHISDRLIACKGVRTGKLTLTSMIIPPLHPLPERKSP
jgi:CopG family nickel-responsive transcriptional regulator